MILNFEGAISSMTLVSVVPALLDTASECPLYWTQPENVLHIGHRVRLRMSFTLNEISECPSYWTLPQEYPSWWIQPQSVLLIGNCIRMSFILDTAVKCPSYWTQPQKALHVGHCLSFLHDGHYLRVSFTLESGE